MYKKQHLMLLRFGWTLVDRIVSKPNFSPSLVCITTQACCSQINNKVSKPSVWDCTVVTTKFVSSSTHVPVRCPKPETKQIQYLIAALTSQQIRFTTKFLSISPKHNILFSPICRSNGYSKPTQLQIPTGLAV